MKITIVTTSRSGFPQRLSDRESLDLAKIATIFSLAGFVVDKIEYDRVAEKLMKNKKWLDDNYILFCSSQKSTYFNYIDNIVFALCQQGANLITSYDLLKAHENKFYQALLAAKLGLRQPTTQLIGSSDDLLRRKDSLIYPLIIKASGGFGSTTVKMAKNFDELMAAYKNISAPVVPPRKNLFGLHKDKGLYENVYADFLGPAVLQEFIAGCDHDWKVLVFGEKIYTLKRNNRKNDFRASGSGLFNFEEKCDPLILNFALSVRKVLNTPFVSLDIILQDDVPYLVEFQAIHFGPYTLTNSHGYYSLDKLKGDWNFIEEKSDYEAVMAHAILDWIREEKV